MRNRVTISYLGIIELVLIGVVICLVENIALKISCMLMLITTLALQIRPITKKEQKIDGELIITEGEDDEHVALGLSVLERVDVLMDSPTATFKIVNKMEGKHDEYRKRNT